MTIASLSVYIDSITEGKLNKQKYKIGMITLKTKAV